MRTRLVLIGLWAINAVSGFLVCPAEESDKVVTHTFRPEKGTISDDLTRHLKLPAGFQVNVFAKALGNARMMAVTDDGVVLVTCTLEGKVIAVRDLDGDGRAEARNDAIPELKEVHGIAIRSNQVYLATTRQIYRASISPGAKIGKIEEIGDPLPEGGQHPRRTLGFDRAGRLYISVGSTCNNCEESNPEHATILRANADAGERFVFARGLRNTIGFAWHPQTDELWGMDHGSDDRGDNLPPEELNHIVEGSNYGWPFCYGNQLIDVRANPPKRGAKEDICARSTAPVLMYQAHSAPIGFLFYSGAQFPGEFRNDAFAVMRGSWNRKPATGYKVVRIRFAEGRPVEFEDFLTGFLSDDGKQHFGRLAGIAMTKDGSLLITDDANGIIYRVSYSARAGK